MTTGRAPAITVEIASTQPVSGTSNLVQVVFRIKNQGPEPIEVAESWLPHGQFRAGRQPLAPLLVLPSGDSALHEREVAVVVPETGVIEIAFLILRAQYHGSAWRVFARIRVEAATGGDIRPKVEEITASRVQADD